MVPGSVFSVTMRIRIRPNYANPTGSGSTTLVCTIVQEKSTLITYAAASKEISDISLTLGLELRCTSLKVDCFFTSNRNSGDLQYCLNSEILSHSYFYDACHPLELGGIVVRQQKYHYVYKCTIIPCTQ